MTAVHQFLPTFEASAVGNHALQVQRVLRSAGYESEIFAEVIRDTHATRGHVHTDYGSRIPAGADDVLVYHMAIGSAVGEFLRTRTETLVLDYHNVTPVQYWQPWELSVTWGMVWARTQLKQLASQSRAAISHSSYSAAELDVLHYRDTSVVPLLVDFTQFTHAVDTTVAVQLAERKASGGADVLFVGWVSPHKCQHDIIRAFSLYRSLYDPHARLHLVGQIGAARYLDACERLVKELDLTDAVFFHGGVSDGALGAHYGNADVLVSMSEHEGVGVPLLEAMHNRIPVVAYAAAAVPETVGGAGLLLAKKTPAIAAAAMDRAVHDHALRATLIARGTERLAGFSLPAVEPRLLETVARVIANR